MTAPNAHRHQHAHAVDLDGHGQVALAPRLRGPGRRRVASLLYAAARSARRQGRAAECDRLERLARAVAVRLAPAVREGLERLYGEA